MEKILESLNNWQIEKKIEIKKINNELVLQESEKSDLPVCSGYHVPIWILDCQNLNGRTYSTRLAERIVIENKVTYVLDGHPLDENKTAIKDIVGIGKNPIIENGILFIDLFIVDSELDQKIEKMIHLDSFVGLSSAGYGELDTDGNIVEGSYILERYCDLVIEPSYGVYIEKEDKRVTEDIEENKDQIIDESSTDEEITESTDSEDAENYDLLYRLLN